MRISVRLRGESVSPSISLSPESVIDFGDCAVGAVTERRITAKNDCAFSVAITVAIAGMSSKNVVLLAPAQAPAAPTDLAGSSSGVDHGLVCSVENVS